MLDQRWNNNVNFATFYILDAVTEKEVTNEIGNLNDKKSCGHDEIPPKQGTGISKSNKHSFIISLFSLALSLMTYKMALLHPYI